MEAYRPEKNFSDAVKGLTVWGSKVVQKDCLVDFIVKKGTDTAEEVPVPVVGTITPTGDGATIELS